MGECVINVGKYKRVGLYSRESARGLRELAVVGGWRHVASISGVDGRKSPFVVAESDSDRRVSDARARLIEYAASHTLDELFERTLDEAEALTESAIGFYDFVDPDQLSLTLQHWSSRTKECCAVRGKGQHSPLASGGVWVECVNARTPVVHNDYQSLPNRHELPEGHVDLARVLVVPVVRRDVVRAILGVGDKRTDYDLTDVEVAGRLASLAWDLAETKITQEELQLSTKRFRAIADNTYDWETWTAPDGTSLYVSPSCERITGHTVAEFMADPSLTIRLAHVDDRARLAEHLRAAANEEQESDLAIEFRVVTPGGVSRWISHVCTPVHDEDGEFLGRRASNRDITERKNAEDRLARERQLLGQVESVAHVGSWRIGLGKRQLSEEAAHILGLDHAPSDGDVFGAVRAVVHPADRELFEGPRVRTLLAEGIRSTDFRIVLPDGTVRWVSTQGVLELGDDAEPIAINGILQDVTERRSAEEERMEHSEHDANSDRLTGLLNLRGFDLVAEQAIAQAERAGQSVGLLFCDLDGLKTINDSLGHPEGDRALRDVATVMESTLRSADAIARIGGDEFVVLAIGNGTEDVAYLKERLQSGFDLFSRANERPYRLSVSIGTASREPGSLCRLEELRATADSNMYAEKLKRRGDAR